MREKYWELEKVLINQENHKVVNEFLLNLKTGYCSPLTVDRYRRFLEHFFGEVEETFTNLSSEKINEWFLTHQTKYRETTITFRLCVLFSFFKFCIQEELMEKSPMKQRWFPRLPQPVPKYLEKDDIAKTRFQSEKESLRDQLLMEFMLTSGCRVAEIQSLNIEHVDLENRTAQVIGKGRKIRQVHFSEKCAVLLNKYLNKQLPSLSSALFVTSTGKRLGIRRIQIIMNRIGKNAELTSSLHPHRLRHTFATELMAKGADLSFISSELGHNNLSTTQIYARLPKREIVALYRMYMG